VSERGERERERGRERKIEKMSETAIHGVEREGGRREKVRCGCVFHIISLTLNKIFNF
jgi:hypothetical protein